MAIITGFIRKIRGSACSKKSAQMLVEPNIFHCTNLLTYSEVMIFILKKLKYLPQYEINVVLLQCQTKITFCL